MSETRNTKKQTPILWINNIIMTIYPTRFCRSWRVADCSQNNRAPVDRYVTLIYEDLTCMILVTLPVMFLLPDSTVTMPRARSARSDVSDADMDHMAEHDEYARLQRMYRVMDNDRKAYCTESQDMIKKQR